MKSLRTSSTPEFRPAGRVLAGLLLLTLFSALLSLCLGSTFVSPALVLQALLGQLEGTLEGDIVQPDQRLSAGGGLPGGVRGGDSERAP